LRLAAVALALARLGAPAAMAASRVVIVLRRPEPVLSPPAPVNPLLGADGRKRRKATINTPCDKLSGCSFVTEVQMSWVPIGHGE
jgi:hypothetical protein